MSMILLFQPMDEETARFVLSWRYEAPYDIYNPDPDDVSEDLKIFLDPKNAYYSITDEQGNVVAYCCFGPEARVKGGDYRSDALDVGMGLRPDLTGKGNGLSYVEAVVDFGRRTFSPSAMRVTIAAFNTRALRVCEKAGFEVKQVFRREDDGARFVVLERMM